MLVHWSRESGHEICVERNKKSRLRATLAGQGISIAVVIHSFDGFLSGSTIAFTIRSVDRSLSSRLIPPTGLVLYGFPFNRTIENLLILAKSDIS